MEQRQAKLIVNKSGGTAGNNAVTYRVTLPNNWIKEMGMDKENRNITLTFDGEKITVAALK